MLRLCWYFLNRTYQIIMIMVISVKTFEYDAWNKANKIITNLHYLVADIIMTFKFPEKVNFKSQILVHEYWTMLDHFCVPVL